MSAAAAATSAAGRMPVLFVQHPDDAHLKAAVHSNTSRAKKLQDLLQGRLPTVSATCSEEKIVVDVRTEFTAAQLFGGTMRGLLREVMVDRTVLGAEPLYVVAIESLGYAGDFPMNIMFGTEISQAILDIVKDVSNPDSFKDAFVQAYRSERASFLEMNANPSNAFGGSGALAQANAALMADNGGIVPLPAQITQGGDVLRDIYNKYAGVTAESIERTIVMLPKERALTSENSLLGMFFKSTSAYPHRFVYTSKSVAKFDVSEHTYCLQATRKAMQQAQQLMVAQCANLNAKLRCCPADTKVWFNASVPWAQSKDGSAYRCEATGETVQATRTFTLRLRLQFTVRSYTSATTDCVAIVENSAGAWPRDVYDVSEVDLATGALTPEAASLGGSVDALQGDLEHSIDAAGKAQQTALKRKKGKAAHTPQAMQQ